MAEGITPWAGASGAVIASAQVASSVSADQGGAATAQPDALIIPASEWARALGSAPVEHAVATKAPPAAHTPAARATPAVDTARVNPAQRPAVQPKAALVKPYFIYDSVTPIAIPKGQRAAVYANGKYQASWSALAGRGKVLWIDTNGSNFGANVLDVEPGDASPAGAAQWVKARLNAHKDQLAIVYTYLSAWQAVKARVGTLPSWMQAKVRYWIADPTGVNHVVSGSNATQWYWGKTYDITTANPGFEAR